MSLLSQRLGHEPEKKKPPGDPVAGGSASAGYSARRYISRRPRNNVIVVLH
jgi:hypothetical protein